MYTSTNVLESSRELDDLFQLTERSRKLVGGYTPYTWKYEKPIFGKGCNLGKVFPLSINLYLKTCTQEELSDLLDNEHFLVVLMYYNNECTTSYISVMNLTIADLHDQHRKDLMLSCRNTVDVPLEEQFRERLIPCEINIICDINMKSIWHLFGADRTMCMNRRIEMGACIQIQNRMLSSGFVVGLEMIERDPYPEEDTEEKIRESEDLDRISITRF